MKTINNSVGTRSNYPFKMSTHFELPTLYFDQVEGEMNKTPNVIYKAKNEERKCFYIGYSTKGLDFRKNRHKYDCFTRELNIKFYNFLRKYSWDSFTWETLAVYSTPEELQQAEINWLVEQKKEFPDWECLNLTKGGDGGNTWNLLSEDKKEEIKTKCIHLGENHPLFGTHLSKETKNKITQSLTGKKRTFESIEKQKNSSKGHVPWNKDKKMRPKTKKEKAEQSKILCKFFLNHPEKISRGSQNKAAKLSEEEVKKIKILFNKKGITTKELAKKYKVCRSTIYNILENKNWKHIL